MEMPFHAVPGNVACSRVYCTPRRVSIGGGHNGARRVCRATNTRLALGLLFLVGCQLCQTHWG